MKPPELPKDELAQYCREHNVRKLSIFGSALSDEFGPDSDLDLLVEFGPGHTPGFLGLVDMEMELSEMLGVNVDLRTPGELSRHFRDEVIAGAKVQYAG